MLLKIKKWVGLALALTMLTTAPLPALAAIGRILTTETGSDTAYQLESDFELSDEQKQALEKIYEIIPELRKLTEISVSRDERAGTWHVWLCEVQDADEAIPFAADARLTFETDTGELFEFSMRVPAWASEEEPSRELAHRQADAFIRQLLGDKADQYQMGGFGVSDIGFGDSEGNEISWRALSVLYYPLVNGLPFLDRTTRVDVDAAGRVTGYDRYDHWYRYDPAYQALDFSLFPPAQAAVNLAAAEQIQAEKTSMQLTYDYPYANQDSPLLVYMADLPEYIDALTGEPAEIYAAGQGQQKQIKLVGQGGKLTVRNQAEAEALLSRQIGVDMGKMDYHQSENDGWCPENEVWYSWYMIDEEEQSGGQLLRSVSLQTLADSGEIVGYQLQDYTVQNRQGALSQEEAFAAALCFLEKMLPTEEAEMQLTSIWPYFPESVPGWVNQVLLEQEYLRLRDSQEISFYFGRLHQGIPVAETGYSVTVSLVTGEVTGYSKHGETMPTAFPDVSQAVPAEQAKAEYLRNTSLQLAYIWSGWLNQRAPAPRLVYTTQITTDRYFIDALTGKIMLLDPTAN